MGKAKNRKNQLARSRAKIQARQSSPEHDPDAPIPPEMVQTYMEIHQWAAHHPEDAERVLTLTLDDDIVTITAGIAWADELGLPADQCKHQAGLIQTWSVLTGYLYLFDWPEPIAAMSPHEIVDNCRQMREQGLIPRPRKDDRT